MPLGLWSSSRNIHVRQLILKSHLNWFGVDASESKTGHTANDDVESSNVESGLGISTISDISDNGTLV